VRVLLDSCVWGGVRGVLAAGGFDVASVGDPGPDPGDEEVMARAHRERRTLVTLDKDFGEMAVVHRRPHHGIIRLVNVSARRQAPLCTHLLSRYGDELVRGAIVTADDTHVRIRPPSEAPPSADGE
jgi:predicted nuclease of predicted toxin-antitoxin system